MTDNRGLTVDRGSDERRATPSVADRLGLKIRDGRQGDVAFILATWKRRMRNLGDRAHMTNTVYFDHEGARIESILFRPATRVAVICQDPESDHLLGYAVHEQVGPVFVLHFAHIKGVYQRMGILTWALKNIYPDFCNQEIAATHITPEMAPKLRRYRVKFNPYL